MSRGMLFFDLETTGTDAAAAHIVQMAFIGEGVRETFVVRPPVPIPADASSVHGLTDADVADAPTFSVVAGRVQALVEGRTLVGYNSRDYDVPLLHQHLVAAGEQGLVQDEFGEVVHPEIDLYRVWRAHEGQRLVDALRRFRVSLGAGERLHDAVADAGVLPDLMDSMVRDLGLGPEELKVDTWSGAVDRGGCFVFSDEGVRFAFGKHRGELAREQTGYLRWMQGASFGASTTSVVRRLLAGALR